MASKNVVLYQLTVTISFRLLKNGCIPIMTFLFRELISNGCDAITKLKKLEVMGKYSFPENYKNKIQVIVNAEEKT